MAEALAQGERIEIRGFGSFSVKHYPARERRNPKTGESILVAASKTPFFKVAKELRLRVDGKIPPATTTE
jgi:integration host factor subunit beta